MKTRRVKESNRNSAFCWNSVMCLVYCFYRFEQIELELTDILRFLSLFWFQWNCNFGAKQNRMKFFVLKTEEITKLGIYNADENKINWKNRSPLSWTIFEQALNSLWHFDLLLNTDISLVTHTNLLSCYVELAFIRTSFKTIR